MSDPQTPNAAQEPQMPEPAAWVDSLKRPAPHCVTSLQYCSVLQHERGDHLRYIPMVTTEAAKAHAEALAAHRVAEAVAAERDRCADLCEGMNLEDGPHTYASAIRYQPPATGKEQA